MTWNKGESGNPGGLSTRQLALKRRLDGLTVKAVEVLADVMETGSPSERLSAAKEVFDRAIGKPKQQATISVEHGPSAHLAALVGLALSTAHRVQTAPGIDAEPPGISRVLTIDALPSDADAAPLDADAGAESLGKPGD